MLLCQCLFIIILYKYNHGRILSKFEVERWFPLTFCLCFYREYMHLWAIFCFGKNFVVLRYSLKNFSNILSQVPLNHPSSHMFKLHFCLMNCCFLVFMEVWIDKVAVSERLIFFFLLNFLFSCLPWCLLCVLLFWLSYHLIGSSSLLGFRIFYASCYSSIFNFKKCFN